MTEQDKQYLLSLKNTARATALLFKELSPDIQEWLDRAEMIDQIGVSISLAVETICTGVDNTIEKYQHNGD